VEESQIKKKTTATKKKHTMGGMGIEEEAATFVNPVHNNKYIIIQHQ